MRLPTRLLRRNPNSHKGDFGHVLILAGSTRFSGAAVLSGLACLRSGAGLVTLGIPENLTASFIKIKPLEAMILPLAQTKEGTLSSLAFKEIREFAKKIDVLAIGPGLTLNKSTQSLVKKVIKSIAKPMVVDADGLNAIAGHLNILPRNTPVILTPHAGEMARLLGTKVSQIQKDRKKVAKDFVNRYNVMLVLKGRETIVADRISGIYVNKTGNPGMAKAGSGDVLTGMISAFLAQGLSGFEAAKYAVYLHGLAGDLAAKEKTQIAMIATDLIAKIPEAIKISS